MRVLRLVVGAVVAGLLAGGMTMTVLRVLQPDSAPAVGVVAMTPLALAAYAVVVVLVVLPALRRRGTALLVLGVALGGIGLHGWWLAPLYTGATPLPAAGEDRFVVMSANVEGITGAEGLGVVETASARGVDLLALVELTPEALASMDAGGLATLFPHRVGGDDSIGATMLLSRTPVGPATQVATVDGLVADVVLAGRSVRTLVVHPIQPLSDPDEWRRDHEAVLAAAGDGADLLLGDLNATLDHEPLQALADAGMHDATERANGGWQPTWPTDGGWRSLPFPVVQIDHVLVGDRLTALGTDTVRLAGTDHAAILAEVAFT